MADLIEQAQRDDWGYDKLIEVKNNLNRRLREIRKELRDDAKEGLSPSIVLCREAKELSYQRDVLRGFAKQMQRYGCIRG